jgi:hypothetical protein
MAAVTTTLRRKLALAAGLVCLATPVLSSCGFDYATDRPNVIANGGYEMSPHGLRVLGTRIVASADGKGVFVATIALNPTADAATDAAKAPKLTQISAGSNSPYQLQAKSFSPIAVGDTGSVNLADASTGGVAVTGSFKAGSIVPVKLTFSDGTTVTLQTPVVTQCGDYASVAPQGASSQSANSAPQPAGSGAYDCSYPSLPPIGE